MSTPENVLDFIGRLLMSIIFAIVGIQQALNAMAGGMLVLCARGPGDWSVDSRKAAA
jgi:uncharacterized membrane protein YphA (DoxX/SURF4 family)